MTILHSITTVAGHNKEAAKKALNQPVVFTHIALGDDDRYPTGGETELGNEVHRGAITGKGTVPGVPNATFFDITVPDDVATFFAREIGLIDEDGVLYALSRYDAPIPKFGPDSANQSAFTFRIIVIFSATANIVIEVDPGWKHTIDAQLRPDFRSAEAIQNDPPVAPVAGQTWIVGIAPTGVWGGHQNELAEWSANGWSFIPPTPWMHVGLADRTDWRWDHTLGVPAWIEWKASQEVAGPVLRATPADVAAGVSEEMFISPLALKNRIAPVAVITSAAVGYAWSTLTNVTNLVGFSNDIPGLAIGASAVTFDADSAGLYSISLTATAFNAGVEVQMNAQTTGSNVAVYPVAGGDKNGSQAAIMGRSATHRFAAGDTLYFQLRQIINGGGSATLAARVTLTRLGA